MLHPTIAASLRGYVPSQWTNSPANDAADHFDRMADTIDAEVDYLGITFYVEVNRHSRNACEITRVSDGTDWFYEFSDTARRNIARLVLAGSVQ